MKICACERNKINSAATEGEDSLKLYSDQAQSSRGAPSSFQGRLDISDMTGREHCVKSEIRYSYVACLTRLPRISFTLHVKSDLTWSQSHILRG